MKIVRPIQQSDFDALKTLAYSASLGITNLPKDPKLLQEHIEQSIALFENHEERPQSGFYIFVLENQDTKEIEGTCAILGQSGTDFPNYYYEIEKKISEKSVSEAPQMQRLLRVVSSENGPSEMCGLFLERDARKEGLGRFLSYTRFLFIAAHPKRFTETITALMRGYIDEHDASPLWEALGRHFFDVSTAGAYDFIIHHKGKVPEILPDYPIYCDLLSPSIQEYIGATHPNTKPALEMLIDQGFSFSGKVDFIDGGPQISAPRDQIQTVKDSKTARIESFEHVQGPRYIVTNESLQYRAALTPLRVLNEGQVQLNSETASALHLEVGDRIRYIKYDNEK